MTGEGCGPVPTPLLLGPQHSSGSNLQIVSSSMFVPQQGREEGLPGSGSAAVPLGRGAVRTVSVKPSLPPVVGLAAARYLGVVN